ncbi:hypothetical protein C8F01DRAFT_1254026 [Mycena amicta]|nr:hypothetical protein C8F01DRAFT_1254026 [Mycena amicta]
MLLATAPFLPAPTLPLGNVSPPQTLIDDRFLCPSPRLTGEPHRAELHLQRGQGRLVMLLTPRTFGTYPPLVKSLPPLAKNHSLARLACLAKLAQHLLTWVIIFVRPPLAHLLVTSRPISHSTTYGAHPRPKVLKQLARDMRTRAANAAYDFNALFELTPSSPPEHNLTPSILLSPSTVVFNGCLAALLAVAALAPVACEAQAEGCSGQKGGQE